MGNKITKNNDIHDELLPIEVREIIIDNTENSGNFVQFLVGDYPMGYLKADTEVLPPGVCTKEYNDTLADAYLCGII